MFSHGGSIFWFTVFLIHVNGQQLTLKKALLNSDVRLTCSYSSVASPVLQWYGPGDVKYTEDTNIVQSYLSVDKDDKAKVYTLTIQNIESRFTGVYSCRVNAKIETQILLTLNDSSITNVYTRVEGNVTLKCLDPVPTSTQWVVLPQRTKYALNNDINPNIPARNRISVDVTTRSLIINFVKLSDIAEYQCADISNPNNRKTVHLLPYLAPAYPKIENTELVEARHRTRNIIEDSQLTLTCNSPNGVPPAVVTWKKQDESNVLAKGYNTATYSMRALRNEDLKVYVCQSSSPAYVSNISTNVLLYFRLKPLTVSVIRPDNVKAGTEMTSTCTSNGSRPPATTTWSFRNTWVNGYTNATKENPLTKTYIVSSTMRQQLDKSDNGKSIRCKASNEALPGGRLSDAVSLKVIFGPGNVLVSGNRQVLADGKNRLTLTCSTDEYNEFIYMTWYNGSTVLPNNAVVVNTTGSYQGKVTSQTLELVPTYEQDENMIKCEAINQLYPDLKASNIISLNLRYFPKTELSLSQEPEGDLLENTEFKLVCTITGGKPDPRLSLSCQGISPSSETQSTTGDHFVVITTYRANRSLNGIICTCTGVQAGQWTDTVNSSVNVVYAPDVTIAYSNNTYNGTSSADGNPTVHMFYAWEHKTELGQHVRSLTGKSTSNQSTLMIPDLGDCFNFQNNGYYVCTASNGIPDKNGIVNISKEVYYYVAAPPVFENAPNKITVEIYSNVSIKIPFYSNPKYISVKWLRRQGNDLTDISGDRITQKVTDVNISFPFRDQYVTFKGQTATVFIQHIQQNEFAKYIVRIKNSIGEKESTVEVKSAGPPNPPVGIAAVCTCFNTAEIIWISKSNGGKIQYFYIGVKTIKEGSYTIREKFIDPGEDKVVKKVVDGLDDKTHYFFTVYAENVYGKAMLPTDLDCITPEKVIEQNYTEAANTASVVLFVLSAIVVFCVVIGISIRYFINRQRNTQHKKGQLTKLKEEKEMNTINIYQGLIGQEQQADNQYQQLESSEKSQTSKKGNVYDVLGHGNPPNIYDELDTAK